MPGERSIRDVLRNMLQYGDLSFRDFVEIALYYPAFGYYARAENPVGKGGDYITAPTLSPAFSYAFGNLVREFMSRTEGEKSTIVDIGCGDARLIRAVADDKARFFGIDRNIKRGMGKEDAGGAPQTPVPLIPVPLLTSIDQLPKDGTLLFFSNELYDAFPFGRLVQRGDELHELWVAERDGVLDWVEREAPGSYEDYFAARGIELANGQFADISLEWEAFHEDVVRFADRALFVTIDYGFEQKKLFDPRIRRFGTAAAYAGQRVTRDLLANPGEQDLTAHINFTDLERAGERNGATTLFFDNLAKFLLTLGITEHELFKPLARVEDWEARDEARRLILPDGIGHDLRVLVQAKGLPLDGWSFQKKLF
jgi:SAM-dependent MidA family methyltransferase